MRKFWIMIVDARARAVVRMLEAAGPGIGDLAVNPGDAPTFFRPLRAALAEALKEGRHGSLAAASAAEDFAVRLEKVFSDMALLGVAPDAALLEALRGLQQACAEAPGLLSAGGKARAAARTKALCAAGRKTLAMARAAAEGAGFPQNLKFSSIYSGLDAVFDALDRCGDALFRI